MSHEQKLPIHNQELSPPPPPSFAQRLGALSARWIARGASQEYVMDPAIQEQAQSFEANHFVEDAPRVADLAHNASTKSEQTAISYWKDPLSTRTRHIEEALGNATEGQMTEQEALDELDNFFDIASRSAHKSDSDFDPAAAATQLREGLHFIREQDLDTAAKGIAGLWKTFLHGDSKRQLVVPRNILGEEGVRKSGDYVYDKVMANFTEEERKRYGSRILPDLKQAKKRRDPALTKIVLLDDWAISGTQEQSIYARLSEKPGFSQAHVERNYVAASAQQLDQQKMGGRSIPLYAYYRVPESMHNGAPLVTGSHSSVDFNVANTIEKIALELGGENSTQPLPALANIKKPY